MQGSKTAAIIIVIVIVIVIVCVVYVQLFVHFAPPETASDRIARICHDNYSTSEAIAQCELDENLRVIDDASAAQQRHVDQQVGN